MASGSGFYMCFPMCMRVCVSVLICFSWFSFDSFSFICFVLIQLVCFWFMIFDFYSLDACLFSNERQKECGFSWERRWGGPQSFRGKETIIRMYYMKKTIFNKIKKEQEKRRKMEKEKMKGRKRKMQRRRRKNVLKAQWSHLSNSLTL